MDASATGTGTTGAGSSSSGSGGSGSGSSGSGTATSSSAAAYVYVTNQPTSGGAYQIMAYSADVTGQLTPVSGSPFNQNVYSLGASGGYLLGSSQSGPTINSYTIGSNGGLTLATQFNYQQQTGYQSSGGCGGVGGFVFDQTGQSLYTAVANINCSSNNAVASFAFDSANGTLSYLGNANIGYEASSAISLLGNNNYAYSALNDNCMYGGISSFVRANGGLLSNATDTTVTPEFGPPAPPGATSSSVKEPSYAAAFAAADTSNHVAMAEYPCYGVAGVPDKTVQLAVYTADANGNLTTTDTYATMPATQVTTPLDMKASPSGALLAVGGIGGLQIFHFNGANSITSDTPLLTTSNIRYVAWDNSNHLYAITYSAPSSNGGVTPGHLYVFSVTGSGATAAPGSPYTITAPGTIAVLSE